jgi:hypothetical protein
MEARMSPARAPEPPEGSFDPAAAARGRAVFEGRATCATYHVPPLFSEPGWPMHTAAEIGIDDFQASRAPDRRYRTTPLRGLFARSKGGFHHDGRFPDLRAVVDHYDRFRRLGLTEQEKRDLIELRITELGQRAIGTGPTVAPEREEGLVARRGRSTGPRRRGCCRRLGTDPSTPNASPR